MNKHFWQQATPSHAHHAAWTTNNNTTAGLAHNCLAIAIKLRTSLCNDWFTLIITLVPRRFPQCACGSPSAGRTWWRLVDRIIIWFRHSWSVYTCASMRSSSIQMRSDRRKHTLMAGVKGAVHSSYLPSWASVQPIRCCQTWTCTDVKMMLPDFYNGDDVAHSQN